MSSVSRNNHGRPRRAPDSKLDAHLTVNLQGRELETLHGRAADEGSTASQVVRRLIRRYLKAALEARVV